jgi:enoyl-CoA hydratase
MKSTPPPIRTWIDGAVLHIELTRPPANALGLELVAGLANAASTLAQDATKVAVISSAVPRFFAAGADIVHMSDLSADAFIAYGDAVRGALEAIAASGRPTIAAIDGVALGGGLELAMACSLRFATPASRLGLPEVKLGLIPGAGGTQRLPRLVGRGRALELLLTGAEVRGAEAFAIGLVDRLVTGDVVAEATAFAHALAAHPISALSAILTCVDAAEGPLQLGLEAEADAVLRTFVHGEAREGIAAFVEKRRPSFA